MSKKPMEIKRRKVRANNHIIMVRWLLERKGNKRNMRDYRGKQRSLLRPNEHHQPIMFWKRIDWQLLTLIHKRYWMMMGWRLISIPFLGYIRVIRKICVRKRNKKQRTKTSVQEYPRFTSTTMYFTTHRHDMIPKTSSSNISFNPTKITYQRKGTSIKRHNQGIKGNKNKRHDLESCLCPLFYYKKLLSLLYYHLFSFHS